jgi:hypothetical protein
MAATAPDVAGVIALSAEAKALELRGHMRAAADKYSETLDAALALRAPQCLIVAFLRLELSNLMGALGPGAGPQGRAQELLLEAVETLSARRAAGTLLPGKCRPHEVAWHAARCRQRSMTGGQRMSEADVKECACARARARTHAPNRHSPNRRRRCDARVHSDRRARASAAARRWSTLIGYEALLRAAASFLPAAAASAAHPAPSGSQPASAAIAAEMLVNLVADALNAVATRVKSCPNPTSLLWIAAEMHFVNASAAALSPSALPPPRGDAATKLIAAMRAVMATGVVQSADYGTHAAAMEASQAAMSSVAASRTRGGAGGSGSFAGGFGGSSAGGGAAHDAAACTRSECAHCAGLRAHSGLCALGSCRATVREDGTRLQLCGACRVAAYCCQAHQRADWKRHKVDCSGAFAAQCAKK